MDRYYTPEPLARELLGECSFEGSTRSVVDPSCGGGALLDAAEKMLGVTECAGIDLDGPAIRSLRRSRPHWRLSVADVLCERSIRGSAVARGSTRPDLLLLNPPFSQSKNRSEKYSWNSEEAIRVGRAMLFLLRTIDLFRPTRGVFAIVPESLMYLDLDSEGRAKIQSHFKLRELASLKSTAFSGARVRSVAIELLPNGVSPEDAPLHVERRWSVGFERGTLPVHQASPARNGVPFVHTSDLVDFVKTRSVSERVSPGRVRHRGWALLLPRVGLPNRSAVKACFIRAPLRLSDCVIALWCNSRHDARAIEDMFQANWHSLLGLYRGTGARYVTVARFSKWLESMGVLTYRP